EVPPLFTENKTTLHGILVINAAELSQKIKLPEGRYSFELAIRPVSRGKEPDPIIVPPIPGRRPFRRELTKPDPDTIVETFDYYLDSAAPHPTSFSWHVSPKGPQLWVHVNAKDISGIDSRSIRYYWNGEEIPADKFEAAYYSTGYLSMTFGREFSERYAKETSAEIRLVGFADTAGHKLDAPVVLKLSGNDGTVPLE
ncbi:MAG: hypothetical protein WC712_09735, partial [Candidatus Brocadiia bacterium]